MGEKKITIILNLRVHERFEIWQFFCKKKVENIEKHAFFEFFDKLRMFRVSGRH